MNTEEKAAAFDRLVVMADNVRRAQIDFFSATRRGVRDESLLAKSKAKERILDEFLKAWHLNRKAETDKAQTTIF